MVTKARAMVEIAAKNTAKNSFKNGVFDSAIACKLGSIPRRSIFGKPKIEGREEWGESREDKKIARK